MKTPTIASLALTAVVGLAACSSSPGALSSEQSDGAQGQTSSADGMAAQSDGTSSDSGAGISSATTTEPGSGSDSGSSSSSVADSVEGSNAGGTSSGTESPASAGPDDTVSGEAGSQGQGRQQATPTPQADRGATQDAEVADRKGPAIALVSKRCAGQKLLTQWRVQDPSGVKSVVVSRDNEYGAQISSTARWMGPETGDGNHWAATNNGSQNLTDQIEVRAVDKLGNTSTTSTTAPAGC